MPDEPPYYEHRRFLSERYGTVLHRVPVALGLGCPHRDPLTGEGGCIFCGEEGSRAAHLRPGMSLAEQVSTGIRFGRERYGATQFMAYFQAFTSTNAPVARLRELFREVLQLAEFRAVVVGTRPDCLPPDTLDFLSELATETDLWVELGVQTANDETLRRISRGHDFACTQGAVQRLASRGIHPAAHVILGLPGETCDDFQATARQLARLPFEGIKIHNLHVLAGTRLAELWRAGDVPTLDEHAYAEALMGFLRCIPRDWPVMRLTSDSPPNRLLAPRWWLSKGEFVEYVRAQMRRRGWRQGDFVPGSAPARGDTEEQSARDGPAEADRHAGSGTAVVAQATLVAADLRGRLTGGAVRLLNVAFGQGFAALAATEATGPAVNLVHALCLASSPAVVAGAAAPDAWRIKLHQLLASGRLALPGGIVELLLGDPRQTMRSVSGYFDVIVVEADDPDRHPYLFTLEFCRELAGHLADGGVLVSPCCRNVFRAALVRCGLEVGTCATDVFRRGGTAAAKAGGYLPAPLPAGDRAVLTGPDPPRVLRDPGLGHSRREILVT